MIHGSLPGSGRSVHLVGHMKQKTLNTVLGAVGILLGIAGVILILVSIFTEKDVLKWGMLCVALGSILTLTLTLRNKRAS